MLNLQTDYTKGYTPHPSTIQLAGMNSTALQALKATWIAQAEESGVLTYLRLLGEVFGVSYRPKHTAGSIDEFYARKLRFVADTSVVLNYHKKAGDYIPANKTYEERVTIVVKQNMLVVCRYYFHNPSNPECVFVPGDWIEAASGLKVSLSSELKKDNDRSEAALRKMLLEELLLSPQ